MLPSRPQLARGHLLSVHHHKDVAERNLVLGGDEGGQRVGGVALDLDLVLLAALAPLQGRAAGELLPKGLRRCSEVHLEPLEPLDDGDVLALVARVHLDHNCPAGRLGLLASLAAAAASLAARSLAAAVRAASLAASASAWRRRRRRRKRVSRSLLARLLRALGVVVQLAAEPELGHECCELVAADLRRRRLLLPAALRRAEVGAHLVRREHAPPILGEPRLRRLVVGVKLAVLERQRGDGAVGDAAHARRLGHVDELRDIRPRRLALLCHGNG
mmetsp:Transcript_6527/g.20918  ORF Transcript_6527/g.20918 Transcript_6527/m.20918 type:complete len:274 (+) Transcript_6527:52-873(+)